MSALRIPPAFLKYRAFLFILYLTQLVVFTSLALSIEPASIKAFEGDDVVFMCSTDSSNPRTTSIHWSVSPTANQTNTSETFSDRNQSLTSSLTIYDIARTDYGTDGYQITCTLSHELQSSRYQDSSTAALAVHFFPKINEIQCESDPAEATEEGDMLSVVCKVSRGKPPVDMAWRLQQEVVAGAGLDLPPPKVFDEGMARVLIGKVPVSLGLHLNSIICVVSSSAAFPGKKLEYRVGPIKVLFPPHVIVIPGIATLQSSHSTVLTCAVKGYPDDFQYSWSCHPDGIVTGCSQNETADTLTLSLAQPSGQEDGHCETHVTVSCTASNSQGEATDSSMVTIDWDTSTKAVLPTTITHDTILTQSAPFATGCLPDSALNLSVQIQQENWPDSKDITFLCSAEGEQFPNGSKITWYFDGAPVKHSGLPQFQKTPHCLQLQNLSHADLGKELKCTVQACNGSYASSLVLSLTEDGKHVTLLSEEDPLQNETMPYRLTLWQIVLVVVVIAIMTLAGTAWVIVALRSQCRITENPDNKEQGQCQNPRKPSGERETVANSPSITGEIQSHEEPTYEIPHQSPPRSLNRRPHPTQLTQKARQRIQHTYDSRVVVDSMLSTSSGSFSSTSSDSDMYMERSYQNGPSSRLSDISTSLARYVNDEIIQLQSSGHNMDTTTL